MRPDKQRDPVAGPDSGPEPPFPVRISGPVIKGFGRGSKDVCLCFIGLYSRSMSMYANRYLQLGIPTANIPADDLSEKHPDLTTGVYYGVAALDPKNYAHENSSTDASVKGVTSSTLLPAVLSIGYNPFYKNTVRSVVCTRFLWFQTPIYITW